MRRPDDAPFFSAAFSLRSRSSSAFNASSDMLLTCQLVLGFEIEFDLDIVGVAQEDLPARRVRHLVHAIGNALASEVLLSRLEAAAQERDVIDDAGVRPLLPVGAGDVVEVQHRLVARVEPGAGKVERRARAILESQHVLIELNGLAELSGRDVVVIEHADAHIHGASWSGLLSFALKDTANGVRKEPVLRLVSRPLGRIVDGPRQSTFKPCGDRTRFHRIERTLNYPTQKF